MSESQLQKQCKIKTAVVQRVQKELVRYHEELVQRREKVASMRAAGADEHDVRKQIEVQGETEMMIPDTERRLQKAIDELQEFVAVNGTDPSLVGSPQLAAAQELLAAAGGSSGGSAADDEAI